MSFLTFAWECGALKFGSFRTKAGRESPYFFDTGQIRDGASLTRLANFYAEAYLAAGLAADTLLGSAYKGIPLVTALSMALAAKGRNVPFAFNRKETKTHGENGDMVGAPLRGNVVMVDDVLSAGISARECCGWIRAAGANPLALMVALDRQEKGGLGQALASEELKQDFAIRLVALATLDDLEAFIETNKIPGPGEALRKYRSLHGVKPHEPVSL